MKIVVIGGTGRIGARVVAALAVRGHEAVAASPRLGVNSVTGEGLERALDGAAVVIDLVEARSRDMAEVERSFAASTRNLADYGARAGVRHHLLLSVVGAPAMAGSPYFRAKLAQEELVAAGGLPFTIVRATQFFEFLGAIADMGTRDDVVRLPPAGMQPAAADDVAAAVADLALDDPAGGIVEIAGPERGPMARFVRGWLDHAGDARAIVEDDAADYAGGRIAAGTLLPGRDARLLPTRFADWLARAN